MKFLYYSDLHLRDERLKDCSFVLQEIGRAIQKYRPDVVINGGDTFHEKGIIKTKCFDTLYLERCKWLDKHKFMHVDVVGNHDQEDREGVIHPMRVFTRFADWHVIDSPQYFSALRMQFYPYCHDLGAVLKAAVVDGAVDATVHAGILGAYMNNQTKDKDGWDVSLFKPYRNVFSGHYHKRQTLENVHYIGSPMQHSFAEMDQTKGLTLYDSDKGLIQFIEIVGTPKHFEVQIEWIDGKKIVTAPKGIGENDIVRVKLKGDAEQVKSFSRKDVGIKCRDLRMERQVEETRISRLNIEPGEMSDHSGLAEKYMDFIAPALDRDELMEVYGELVDG